MATENSVLAVIRASRPYFRNPNDKIAFAVHASFLAAGYSLIATGSAAFSENPQVVDGEEVGIEGWNNFEDNYAFVYAKSYNGGRQSILVKCLSIGDALVVDVLNLKEKHKEPFHIQISVKDYLTDVDNKSNYGEMYKNLRGLVESLNAGIFNKLEPKVESSSSGSRSTNSITKDPVGTFPVERQQPPPVLIYPPVPSPGNSDLFPGAGAGVFPNRNPGIGGSLLVGPNDPRWFPTGENTGAAFPGGDLVPPGARYDPIGPGPDFAPERFIRNPPRRPGGGGVHPDLPHFQRPDHFDYI